MAICFLLGFVLLVGVLAPTMAAALAAVVRCVYMHLRLGELCLLAGRCLVGGHGLPELRLFLLRRASCLVVAAPACLGGCVCALPGCPHFALSPGLL